MQVFNVQGMSCGHCVKAITQAVQAKDPAASVSGSIWGRRKWAWRVRLDRRTR